MKIIIHEIPPSNNKFIGRNAAWKYREEKKRWEWLVTAAIGSNKPKKPFAKAVVKITYYFQNHIRRDPDNYSGKMILDPLVRRGVLADDSFNHITLELAGRYDKENPRIEVEINEAPNL